MTGREKVEAAAKNNGWIASTPGSLTLGQHVRFTREGRTIRVDFDKAGRVLWASGPKNKILGHYQRNRADTVVTWLKE
jgi:hypothetical protein